MRLLSIIIPAYNAEPYIGDLLKCLNEQITNEVEVIVVDDGSDKPLQIDYPWCITVRQRNGGASAARNTGLDNATGKYVAFIDADDLVAPNYIEKITEKIKTESPDYIYLSWRSMPNEIQNIRVQLKTDTDAFPVWNLCVWNRIYKREMIKGIRFNLKKKIAEDAEFIRQIDLTGRKKSFISDFLYLYRTESPNSLTKRFISGRLDTKRVVYYFDRVSADMTYLIDEFREADKTGEVILLTNRNEIPELADFALVMPPQRIKATERRGQPTDLIEIIPQTVRRQVVLWTQDTFDIGGIETFNYSFVRNLCKLYEITVLYVTMDAKQIARIRPYAEVRRHNPKIHIECDVLIVNRIIDPLPENVTAKRTIQMVHAVKHITLSVPQDKDIIVSVSQAVKDSFGEETKDSKVIRNMLCTDKPTRKPLMLISATRTDTVNKGTQRMLKLARLMDEQGVNYIWLVFTNRDLPADAPPKMTRLQPTLDILPFIAKADYLVQLSDGEAFCYSIVEAWNVSTPTITTPLPVIDELGGKDGETGYIVPFDIPDDYDTTKFLKIPKVKYEYDNSESIQRWCDLLGNLESRHKYIASDKVAIQVTREFFDMEKQTQARVGTIVEVSPERAEKIIAAGYGVEV